MYDSKTHTQRHFIKHIDDVTAIAFHPNQRLVATGELGPNPIIALWDAITMIESVPVKSKLKKGIQQISFSPSGNVFVAVAIDVDHSIGIFDTNTGK